MSEFLKLAEEPRTLNEAVGRSLATWAKGETATSKRQEQPRDEERFRATETQTITEAEGESDIFDGGDSMLDRIIAEVNSLADAHAANDYERKNGRLIGDLPEDDGKRVKAALQAKRSGRG